MRGGWWVHRVRYAAVQSLRRDEERAKDTYHLGILISAVKRRTIWSPCAFNVLRSMIWSFVPQPQARVWYVFCIHGIANPQTRLVLLSACLLSFPPSRAFLESLFSRFFLIRQDVRCYWLQSPTPSPSPRFLLPHRLALKVAFFSKAGVMFSTI